MENVLKKIIVSKEKADGLTKINDQYYGLNEKFNSDDIKEIKNMLIGISSHPIFTNKSTSFNQASASIIYGDNRLNRHKMLFVMTLLRDKSGKKVFSLTIANSETVVMCSNPTPLAMIVVIGEPTTEKVDTETTEEPKVDDTTEKVGTETTEEPKVDDITEKIQEPKKSAGKKFGKK